MNRTCEHLEGPKHNCEYVDWRDKLVLVAEAITDAKVGAEPPDGATRLEQAAWSSRWDAMFHREMRRLTADPFVRASHGQDAFSGVEEEYRDPMEEVEAKGGAIVLGMSSAAKGVEVKS